jgi:hypothetical protein
MASLAAMCSVAQLSVGVSPDRSRQQHARDEPRLIPEHFSFCAAPDRRAVRRLFVSIDALFPSVGFDEAPRDGRMLRTAQQPDRSRCCQNFTWLADPLRATRQP